MITDKKDLLAYLELRKTESFLYLYYPQITIILDYIRELEEENKELHNKMDKAIKFIENEAFIDYEKETNLNLYERETFELLEILKGDVYEQRKQSHKTKLKNK